MPNVDDHGLEVLKKAARNLDPTSKRDYALQTILVADESAVGVGSTPTIQNITVTNANDEIEIPIPANAKKFILKPRKICRMRLAFVSNGTNTVFVTVPPGGYWVEDKKLTVTSVFVQTDVANNILEFLVYT